MGGPLRCLDPSPHHQRVRGRPAPVAHVERVELRTLEVGYGGALALEVGGATEVICEGGGGLHGITVGPRPHGGVNKV